MGPRASALTVSPPALACFPSPAQALKAAVSSPPSTSAGVSSSAPPPDPRAQLADLLNLSRGGGDNTTAGSVMGGT
jgi:hypothetical protein